MLSSYAMDRVYVKEIQKTRRRDLVAQSCSGMNTSEQDCMLWGGVRV